MKAPQSHVDFHAHLDACKRCREEPFDLCPVGGRLLKATSAEDQIDVRGLHYGTLTDAERSERNARRAENWRKAGSPPGPIDKRYDEDRPPQAKEKDR